MKHKLLLVSLHMKRLRTILAILFVLLVITSNGWASGIVNGDFSDGLDGWTTEHELTTYDYISPSSAVTVNNKQAVLETQGDNSNITMISLYQWIVIPDWAYTLSFDVWFERGERDGTTENLFYNDSLWASYLDDVLDIDSSGDGTYDCSFFDRCFIALDDSDAYDPNTFDVLPLSPVDGWYHFTADIADLANRTGTLYFDLYDDSDGYYSSAKVDNVSINPVPEPSTIILLGAALVGLTFIVRRRRCDSPQG